MEAGQREQAERLWQSHQNNQGSQPPSNAIMLHHSLFLSHKPCSLHFCMKNLFFLSAQLRALIILSEQLTVLPSRSSHPRGLGNRKTVAHAFSRPKTSYFGSNINSGQSCASTSRWRGRPYSAKQPAGGVSHMQKGQTWGGIAWPQIARGQRAAKTNYWNQACEPSWFHQSVSSVILFMVTESEEERTRERREGTGELAPSVKYNTTQAVLHLEGCQRRLPRRGLTSSIRSCQYTTQLIGFGGATCILGVTKTLALHGYMKRKNVYLNNSEHFTGGGWCKKANVGRNSSRNQQ